MNIFDRLFNRGAKTRQNTASTKHSTAKTKENPANPEEKAPLPELRDGVLIVDGYVESGKYAGNDAIRKVVFTDKVYRIYNAAFKDCRNLTAVEFQSSKYILPEIYAEAFANTPWAREQGDWVKYEDVLLFYQGEPKEKLMIPADVKYIHQLNCVRGRANAVSEKANAVSEKANAVSEKANAVSEKANAVSEKDNAVREIGFEPGSVCEVICKNAFYNCRKLEKITFPEKAVRISEYSFVGCKEIKEIIFPKELPIIRKDPFASTAPTVYIPSKSIDPEKGWMISSATVRDRLDYWLMMLKADPAECFANGTSYKTLLNFAIEECRQLGELSPEADEETIHRVLSQLHHFNLLQKDGPEYNYERSKWEWYVFPEDHFYCRMVYLLFHHHVVRPKDMRKNMIALWLKDEDGVSPEELSNIRKFVETIGYPIGIFVKDGHRDDVILDEDELEEIENRLKSLGKDSWLEEDERSEEVGDLYQDLLSQKRYYVAVEWHVKYYTERYDGGYDEDVPYIGFEHNLVEYKGA